MASAVAPADPRARMTRVFTPVVGWVSTWAFVIVRLMVAMTSRPLYWSLRKGERAASPYRHSPPDEVLGDERVADAVELCINREHRERDRRRRGRGRADHVTL